MLSELAVIVNAQCVPSWWQDVHKDVVCIFMNCNCTNACIYWCLIFITMLMLLWLILSDVYVQRGIGRSYTFVRPTWCLNPLHCLILYMHMCFDYCTNVELGIDFPWLGRDEYVHKIYIYINPYHLAN